MNSLGPEAPGIPQGPMHRAGQPCLVCHDGTTAVEFSVAGTIFAQQESNALAADVLVRLVDAHGETHTSATNCAGNFFVRSGDYQPYYPLWVGIEREGLMQEMESPINGDGSCASCHGATLGPRSVGHVYLTMFDTTLPNGCP